MAGRVYSESELESFASEVQAVLSSCELEQPYDEGGVVWINPHEPLGDVMADAGVPDECREEVAERVRCPSCGGHHELWEEVGVKSQGELRYESLMDEWYEKYAIRLNEFHDFLAKYPYLGVAHELGKELRDGVSRFPSRTIENEEFYRARRITSGKNYAVSDFLPPDPTKCPVGEGRYNHAGQSVMYLADDKDGAAIECVEDDEDRAWAQKFRIQCIDNILDLSDEERWADENLPTLAFGLMHDGGVRGFADRGNSWKPEYFIPRFVADCAREKGFSGILFKSVRHWQSNLVLFKWDATNVVGEGDPEIIEIAGWKRSDWKFKDSPIQIPFAETLLSDQINPPEPDL